MEENHRRDMWLPPDFISNDEFMFMHNRDNLTRTGFDNSFPASFPSSSASSFEFRSALESVLASMEAEKERASLLTELTRRLSRSSLRENAQAIALAQRNLETSWFVPGPQKPALDVAGIWCPGTALPRNFRPPCSPYQLPSPPSMAVGACHDPWYEIYAAAEAAAVRRRMNGLDPLRTRGGVVSPTHRHLPAVNLGAGYCTCQCLSHNFPQPNHLVHARQEQAINPICSSIWGRPTRDREPIISQQPPIMGERLIGGDLGLPEPACHRKIAAAGSGSEGKREIAGTGVFIPAPRSYGSTQPGSSQKKTARPVQSPKRNLESFSSTRQAKPSKNEASPSDFDEWVAERDVFLQTQRQQQQQQKALGLKAEEGGGGGGIGRRNEVCLPQEWPY